MKTQELQKLCSEIVNVIGKSKPTFFVKNKKTKISTEEWLQEQKAQITTDVEFYFINLLNK